MGAIGCVIDDRTSSVGKPIQLYSVEIPQQTLFVCRGQHAASKIRFGSECGFGLGVLLAVITGYHILRLRLETSGRIYIRASGVDL